jgi:hypothetical protein
MRISFATTISGFSPKQQIAPKVSGSTTNPPPILMKWPPASTDISSISVRTVSESVNDCTDAGIVSDRSDEQWANAWRSIAKRLEPDSIVTLDSSRQSLKLSSQIVSTDDGMEIDRRDLHALTVAV